MVLDLKSVVRKGVRVRVPPSAPFCRFCGATKLLSLDPSDAFLC